MLDNKIVRWYNQNRKSIWRIIGIVALVLIIIRLANHFAELSLKNGNNNNSNIVNEKAELQTESIISETKISKETAKSNNEILDEFVQYGNNGDIEKAYNLLTDDCKEALYKNVEQFRDEYYNIIFTGERMYTKENWYSKGSGTTYRVTYTNNLLADGGVKQGQSFADYITVVKESNDNYKLNIGQFIGKEEINKEYEDDNIKIEVVSKQIFRMHETYQITFTNKTENETEIYDNTQSKWYITDKDDKNSNAAISEIPQSWLKLTPQIPSKLDVKYIKTYNPDKTTKKIIFENMKINDKYINVEIKL